LRGSQTNLDWIRDFRSLAKPTRVGHAHIGFFEGMSHMWSDLKLMLGQPAMVTGHSLGAAHATILTALMIADGFRRLRASCSESRSPAFSISRSSSIARRAAPTATAVIIAMIW
jgi:surfactin synthase thioesterase subunit